MIPFPETDNRQEFYETINSEYPLPERRPAVKNQQTSNNIIAWRDYPIEFGKTKIDYHRVLKHTDSLERRLKLSKKCAEEVQNKCKTVAENESLDDSSKLGDDFIISVEYFFQALRSTWDIMAKLLTWVHALDLEEYEIDLFKVKDHLYPEEKFGETVKNFVESDTAKRFNKVRKRLTHHLMPELSVIEEGGERKVCLELDQVMLPVVLPRRVTRPLRATDGFLEACFGEITNQYSQPSFPDKPPGVEEDYLRRPL